MSLIHGHIHTVMQDETVVRHAVRHRIGPIGKYLACVWLAIVLAMLACPVSAGESSARLDLGPLQERRLTVLADPSWSLSLTDVIAPERQVAFRPVQGSSVNFGYTRNANWLRLELKAAVTGKALLSLAPNFLDFIDVYVAPEHPGLGVADFTPYELGDHRPLSADGLSGLQNVVPLALSAGETTVVYIRIANSNSSTHLNIGIYPTAELATRTSAASLLSGLWFGGMGVLLVIQLVFFYFDRKAQYPLLALSTLGIMLVYAGNLGLSRMLLFPDNGAANDLFMGASAWFGLFASALAYSSILELPRLAPRLHRVYQASAAVGLVGIGFAIFKSNIIFGPIGNNFALLMGVVNVVQGLRTANENGAASRLRAAAFCVLWIGSVLSLSQRQGYFGLPNVFWHAYAISGLVQAILLTGALAVRLRAAEALNSHMREQALVAAQDAERTANALVVEKTRELVSARQIAEDALQAELRSQQQQVRFMEVISHQYRTPLAAIRSNVDSIGISLPAADEGNLSRVKRIQRAIVRLVEMLEVNLARSRLQGPSFQPEMACVAAGDIVVAAAARARDLMPAADIAIDLGPSAQSLRVKADAGMLELAIVNLLENAVKFSAVVGASQVVLSLGADDRTVRIAVRDRGIGIPADELERVMIHGVRGANVGSVEGSGTGLSLVSRVVTAHGGSVGIASNAQEGTVVEIALPLATGGDVLPKDMASGVDAVAG